MTQHIRLRTSVTRDPSGSEDLIASWALHSRPFLTSTRGFKRVLDKHAQVLFDQNKIMAGRLMCCLLFHQLKFNGDLGTHYGVQVLVVVERQGDSAAQVAKFRDRWKSVIENPKGNKSVSVNKGAAGTGTNTTTPPTTCQVQGGIFPGPGSEDEASLLFPPQRRLH